MKKRTITGGEWREGYRPPAGVTIEGALGVFRKLYAAGDINVHVVKEQARAADSPIHGICDWDDASAAESYRDIQVRHFLRSFQPVFKDTGEAEPLIHVPPAIIDQGQEGTYLPLSEVMQRPDAFARALNEAQSFAASGVDRVRQLESLLGTADDRLLLAARQAAQGFSLAHEALAILAS